MKTKLIKLSIILGALLCLSAVIGVTVNAETTGSCGDNLTYTFDDNGTLTISGSGEMYDYTTYKDTPWYSYQGEITSLAIGSGVTHIGERSFQYCSNLTSLNIPDNVTSSGKFAFAYCSGLTSVTIGNGMTEIPRAMFQNCKALTSITIPDCISSIGYGAFHSCLKLESVTLGNGVTYIDDFAFCWCESLEIISFPEILTHIGNAAFEYTGLKSVKIPDGVNSINELAFGYCSNLTQIELPDTITNIEKNAFYQCAYYNNASNWTNNVLYIGDYLIDADTSLSGKYTIKSGTKVIGSEAFYMCSSLTNIVIPESVIAINASSFSNTGLKSVTIPNGVTKIEDSTFMNCSDLSSVHISEGVTTIGADAFYQCSSLTDIVLPDNVTSIGDRAFSGCDALRKIRFSRNVTTIGMAAFPWFGIDVYYNGSKEDWEKISIESGNDGLNSSHIYYPITITYDLNGGEGTIEPVSVLPGDTVVFKNIPYPREGYSFLGWATTVDATKAKYKPGDSTTFGETDIVLYAVWEEIPYTSTRIISGNGYKIYMVSLNAIPAESTVIIACYNDGVLTYTESRNDSDTLFTVLNTVEYDEVKVFVWDTFTKICPITEPEKVTLTSV